MSLPVASQEDAVSTQTAQPSAEEKHSREDLSAFFAIGMMLNIVLVIAFIVWGVKQWKKHGTSKK